MAKIAIITDLHFGARGDNRAVARGQARFFKNTFFPRLDKGDIDYIVNMGDTFDKRKSVSLTSMQHAIDVLYGPLQSYDIEEHYTIVGNHDSAYRNTLALNSPNLFLSKYSTIIDTPCIIDIAGKPFSFLPWVCKENRTKSEAIANMKTSAMFSHLELAGFPMQKGGRKDLGENVGWLTGPDKVYTGHYHHKSDNGYIHYLGTAYEMTWADYDDPKGFHVLDTDTMEMEYINNPDSVFISLEPNDIEEIDDMESVVRDRFVRLICQDAKQSKDLLKIVEGGKPFKTEVVLPIKTSKNTIKAIPASQTTTKLIDRYLEDTIEDDTDKLKIMSSMMGDLHSRAMENKP